MSANLASSDSFYVEINDACERFEAEWRSGGQPQIEVYVAEVPEAVRPELICELLKLDIYYRRERGDTILPSDYQSYPDHASLIATLLAERVPPEQSTELTQAGRYRLEGRIGRGGMGDVFRAQDPDFHRPLAVKVLKEEFKDHPEMVTRFLEEAKITGQLQHPGVPPVHEIGRLADGRPFLAMKLIKGRTLADLLAERANPSDGLQRFLAIFEQVCQTLAYAHSRGVIHRDLKPANIMVGAFGEVQVMDWGLAKVRSPASRATESPEVSPAGTLQTPSMETVIEPTQRGAVLGTLAYMPPEQARGDVDLVDERSDVFGLGAILCVILTAQPPYRGKSHQELHHQAVSADLADAFARLNRCGADAEVVGLATRCLSQSQTARLPDAAAVAVAVADYQESVRERLRKAELDRAAAEARAQEERRRRTLVMSGLAILGVVVVGLAISLLLLGAAERGEREAKLLAQSKEREANDQRDVAKQERYEALFNSYIAEMNLVQREYEANNISHVLELLDHQIPKDSDTPDFRGFEWYYWYRLTHRELLTFRGHTGWVKAACFSPDGKRVVSGGQDGLLRFWDVATGQEFCTLKGDGHPIRSLCFSPDGKWIVSASGEGTGVGTVWVWDVATGKELHPLKGHSQRVTCVTFSPDSKRIASVDSYGTVKVWDPVTGKATLSFKGHQFGPVASICFSPDCKRIACGAHGSIRIWDAATAQELPAIKGNLQVVECVCFSPDGKRIVAGNEVWDTTTGQHLFTLPFTLWGHRVWSVCFSPDGKRIVTGGSEGNIKIWDASTGQELFTLKGHTAGVASVAISRDGEHLLSAGDQTVRVWNAARDAESYNLVAHNAAFNVSFSSDGKRIAGGGDPTAMVWDADTGQETFTFIGNARSGAGTWFSPDLRRVVTCNFDSVNVWDADTRQTLFTLKDSSAVVRFSPDGNRIANIRSDGTVRVCDAATGQELLKLSGNSKHWPICFSPDSKRIVGGTYIWDAFTGQPLFKIQGGGNEPRAVLPWNAVAFSPDGKLIVMGNQVLNAETGQELFVLKGHVVNSGCFSPDGKRIVTCSPDGTVAVWHARGGQALLTLKGDTVRAESVAFSPYGNRIACGGINAIVKVWEAAPVPRTVLRKRELVSNVNSLFEKLLFREDVCASLRKDTTLSNPERAFALEVAQSRSENPDALNEAAWQVVRTTGLTKEEYTLALRRAKAAVKAAAGDDIYLNTLGVAQYRLGLYEDALATLAKSEKPKAMQWVQPPVVAFQAMAHHRLGHKDHRDATLARLRETMKHPRWVDNFEAQSFLREAETLIRGGHQGEEKK
jgi:WD40 repeat protein